MGKGAFLSHGLQVDGDGVVAGEAHINVKVEVDKMNLLLL